MQGEIPFPVLERELKLPVDSEQMITVCGVRRCGKSSMMKLVANQLVESGVSTDRILWINFDDERLTDMDCSELDEVLQAYREMFPELPLSEAYIFFDEIQNVDNWELFVMRLYKTYCKNIFLSGSNSKMLSSQLATALRGWPIEFEAFPLSFGEYMNFKGYVADVDSEAGRALLVNYCREYLHAGAFPELALMKEQSLRTRKVQGYFNTMMFRDLLEHLGWNNVEVVRYFLRRLMLNITKPTSIHNIYNELKSRGFKLDKNKLYELADMACSVFMFFRVNRWSASLIKENSRLPKYYFIDNGMRNALILPQSDDDGKLLENAVFLELRRRLSALQKITYFQEDTECDFVVQQEEHIESLLQVSWSIADPNTRKREIRGLVGAAALTGCRNCKIITFDEEETIVSDDLRIEVVPIWKWLLAKG